MMRSRLRTLLPSENRRVVCGLSVQPFVAAALSLVIYPAVSRVGRGGRVAADVDSLISVAAGASIAAFFLSFIAALAAAWVIGRDQISLTRVWLFGVMIGNVPTLLGVILAGPASDPSQLFRTFLFASLLGLGGATAFWAIWTLTRPASVEQPLSSGTRSQ